jgi:hypothetical protein
MLVVRVGRHTVHRSATRENAIDGGIGGEAGRELTA